MCRIFAFWASSVVRASLRLKTFLAALAAEDKAALSGCPRQANAGQYAGEEFTGAWSQ